MAEKPTHRHPSIERLADWEAGVLDGTDAAGIAAHVHECALCRLELKRLADFATGDDLALADAGWDQAELRLQRRYEQEIKPRLTRESSRQSEQTVRRRRSHWLPLVPVAVAALLAVLFLSMDRLPRPGEKWRGSDTLRGGGTATAPIHLVTPLEQVVEAPAEFVWRADDEFDAYVLEVFSPDLESVLRVADLRTTRTLLPDSLVARFEPGKTYLWNVQGREGLAEGELSLTAWFRIGPPVREPSPHSDPSQDR